MAKWKGGDKVQLMTDPTAMTVQEVGEDNWVTCVWLDKNKKRCEGRFHEDTLKQLEKRAGNIFLG